MRTTLSVTTDLTLRVLRPADAGILFMLVHRNRAYLREWLPWVDATRSPLDTRRFLFASYSGFRRGDGFSYGIVEGGSLVGVIGFHAFDRVNKVTSLGYWLSREATGRGLMRQSVAACLDHAFVDQGMNRLYVRCAVGNLRSRRIPQALGFRFEGTQREAEWLYDHFVDLEVHSILAREWRAGQ